MTAPFPEIPADSVPFFIRDSYSLTVQPGNPFAHHPGVCSQAAAIPAGSQVEIWFKRGMLQFCAPEGVSTLYNIDIALQLYDMSTGAAVPTDIVATFAQPYSAGTFNGNFMCHSATPGGDAVSHWDYGAPISLRVTAPAAGGPFRVGPRFWVHSGLTAPVVCHYMFSIIGAWKIVS